ncbi:hypothetical protein P691DRAFT_579238 [Macrolepiota fuliginosa MF-IS2]|uniref:F-box domain-containing protein n=1 Tax=Macrolepiota fuliginosa MF-IS2 TaxID=1400762 RepID=A0A9P6C646_9AGAR|nr:hypothetical protein P691DRAFT_579238 [Macrolepiota fuliginosa MF-IS2]
MYSFDDLPDELLVEVLNAMTPKFLKKQEGTRKQELCTLRLVSKRINALITPRLFDSLRLVAPAASGLKLSDCVRYSEIITALAISSPLARVFERTTILYVSIFQLFLDQEDESTTPELTTAILQARTAVQQHLFAAVAALRNLRSVSWLYGMLEPSDITTDFVRALGTLKILAHFEFYGKIDPNNTTISFQPLSNLRSVKVSWESPPTETFLLQVAQLITRSPNLQGLTARNLRPVMEPSFNTLVLSLPQPLQLTQLDLYGIGITSDVRNRIQHFHNLTTLVLMNGPWKAHQSSLWPCLGEHAIHLKSLSTDAMIYPRLFEYLISYMGLEELCLRAKHSADDSGDIVDRFYSILAQHHKTLRKVQLRSPRGKAWVQQPTDAQLEGILKCRKLKELSVCFSFTREKLQSKNTTSVMIWLQAAMQLPELEHLQLCLPHNSLRRVTQLEAAMEFSKAILEEFEEDSKSVHFVTEIILD